MKTEDLATLLATRIKQHHAQQKSHRRTLIALAGGPSSGKTFIASSIADAVTKQGLKAQAVSIEGFVKPSHVLTEDQIQPKGSIDTFHGEAVSWDPGTPHELSCPGVDEDGIFEPVPSGETVHVDSEAIIFEGIYMLADVEPWRRICPPLVDERWFVDVKFDLVRQRVAERRLSQGKASSMEESLRIFDESDSWNARWIKENIGQVDLTLHSDEECWVGWPDGRVER